MGNVLNNYVDEYVLLDVVRRDFDGGVANNYEF
jgi:hypothetical protein